MQHFPPLRASGMRILNFMDDWLILAQSRDTLLSHIASSLGLCVNMQKSILVPSQSITYLGVCFDSVEMRARLSQERSVAILFSLRHFRLGSSVHCTCTTHVLHMHPLQFTFTFMHLADAFIQSDLQRIQAIHFLSVCVFPGNQTC